MLYKDIKYPSKKINVQVIAEGKFEKRHLSNIYRQHRVDGEESKINIQRASCLDNLCEMLEFHGLPKEEVKKYVLEFE